MTREELIQSFPRETVSSAPWFMGAFSLAILVAIGVTIYLKKIDYGVIFPVFVGTLIFSMLVATMGTHFQQSQLQSKQYKWRVEVFYPKYLPTLPEEKLKVVDQIINEDGTVSVVVESKRGEDHLEYISNIHYFPPTQTQSEPYVLARWVTGLSSIGIPNDYYDITLHLPRKEK